MAFGIGPAPSGLVAPRDHRNGFQKLLLVVGKPLPLNTGLKVVMAKLLRGRGWRRLNDN